MSFYSILWLSLAIFCISKYAFAFSIIECRENKPVNEGSNFIFECRADQKINYAVVEHNQKKCSFKVTNYIMKVDDRECDFNMRTRISVDQYCAGDSSLCKTSPRKNTTFTITNVLEISKL